MKKTIAIIPARGGSKRLPRKNALTLGDHPLVAHSILYAKQNAQIIDDIYVSTDDSEIAEIAIKYGAKVITRPPEISGDNEPTVSALKHVLLSVEQPVDSVVLLQPTNPLRPATLLTEAYAIFSSQEIESLFTVSRSHHKFGKILNNRFSPFNYEPGQRSQDLEPLYFENGLLYIVKSDIIMEEKIITDDAFPMIVDHPFGEVDIDTEEDFRYAEFLLNIK
ncbi:MAG: acylneuraminate cytidylyltransferase family protein [Flavobacterium sp.]|nr:acylneuraminate cytidylyltransferase family protein [Flavobacterium sp.]